MQDPHHPLTQNMTLSRVVCCHVTVSRDHVIGSLSICADETYLLLHGLAALGLGSKGRCGNFRCFFCGGKSWGFCAHQGQLQEGALSGPANVVMESPWHVFGYIMPCSGQGNEQSTPIERGKKIEAMGKTLTLSRMLDEVILDLGVLPTFVFSIPKC